MAVIKDYVDGECRVIIHDDCVVKTKEEAEEIKRTLAAIYVEYRRKEFEERVSARVS